MTTMIYCNVFPFIVMFPLWRFCSLIYKKIFK